MSTAKPSGKSRAKDLVIVLVLILVAVGAIAGFGFYHEEVSDYVRLRGWDLGEIPGLTQQFLQAMAAEDGERVAAMLVPNSKTLQAVREGGKVTALTTYKYGSRKPLTLKELAPTPNPKIGKPKLVLLEGGAVKVDADYPGFHLIDLRWDRTDQGWKVAQVLRIKAGE